MLKALNEPIYSISNDTYDGKENNEEHNRSPETNEVGTQRNGTRLACFGSYRNFSRGNEARAVQDVSEEHQEEWKVHLRLSGEQTKEFCQQNFSMNLIHYQ